MLLIVCVQQELVRVDGPRVSYLSLCSNNICYFSRAWNACISNAARNTSNIILSVVCEHLNAS